MDSNKYKNTGIGLSKTAFQKIYEILERKEKCNIIEFGSGISTNFFVDYTLYTKKNNYIKSYDDNPKYSYQNTNNYKFIDLNIKNLIQFDDNHFNNMMNIKKYMHSQWHYYQLPPPTYTKYWRPRNIFYEIEKLDDKKYDIALIDGPHGNGRNIAFLHLIGKLNPKAYIIIDDITAKDEDFHYDFIPYLKKIFDVNEIYTHKYTSKNGNDEWENGGNFAIYQLK
jgi:hypothetical protein